MNRIQSKLVKLAEEASEVAKEALKAVHYPRRDYNGRTPGESLREELIDLLIVARILQSLRVFKPIYEADVREQFARKHPKVAKYTDISYQLGALDDPWVPSAKDIER